MKAGLNRLGGAFLVHGTNPLKGGRPLLSANRQLSKSVSVG